MINLKRILYGLAVALPLILILQNTSVVTLRFLFWEFSLSQVILLPLVLGLGLLIGFVLGRRSWDW